MAEQAGTTDSTETVDEDSSTAGAEEETATVDWKAEAEKWKSHSRKNEEKAKANADAAAKLREIEDANKSEQEKLAEALEAARNDANTTKAELARMRAAVKYGLSEDDLELLGSGDADEIETRAEKLAARLAASTKPEGSRPVTGLGKTPDESNAGGSQLERDIREALGI